MDKKMNEKNIRLQKNAMEKTKSEDDRTKRLVETLRWTVCKAISGGY